MKRIATLLLASFICVSCRCQDTMLSEWIDFSSYSLISSNSSLTGVGNEIYHIESSDLLQFLMYFGSPDNVVWDFNGDDQIETMDLLIVLSGYGVEPTYDFQEINLDNLVLNTIFGEGNHLFDSTSGEINGQEIVFAFYKTTPYDEESVFTQEWPRSFTLDVVTGFESYSFTFISNNY